MARYFADAILAPGGPGGPGGPPGGPASYQSLSRTPQTEPLPVSDESIPLSARS